MQPTMLMNRSGAELDAMQGILFGRPECTLFGSEEQRRNLEDHLFTVARLAGALGARTCVFGAPKQRDPGNLSAEEAHEVAVRFLRGVAPAFEREGSVLAFEANARCYGCRFIEHTGEAIALVRVVDHAAIRLQIDTGTILIDGDDPAILEAAAPLAAHFHASEPGMRPVGSLASDHRKLGAALRRAEYAGWKSVEMATSENWRAALRDAARVMADAYL